MTEEARADMRVDVELAEDGLYALHPTYGIRRAYRVYLPKEEGSEERVSEMRTKTDEDLADERAHKEKARVNVIEIVAKAEKGPERKYLQSMGNDELYYFICGLTH